MAKLNFSIALGLAAQNFKSGLSSAQSSLKSFASSVKSAFGMIAGAFAAGQIKAFSKECLDAYSAQMQAETKLATIMKQRMNASDAEVKSIMKLTAAQQKQGVIGDEVQIAGAQQVATFLSNKKALDTLVPAMNNLLAQQKGLSATQGDAVTIGNLMGKVMQGQTSALKRVGITFTEAQEKVLKYGTETERAAMLAQVITDNVGDMNSQLAQTDMGKIQQMNNILGDLKEQIGGAIAPIVSQLAPSIASFATDMANNVTSLIGIIQQNIQGLITFIVAQVAGLKLTQYVVAFVNAIKAQSAQIEANATATAARREAIENTLQTKINQLRVLEAQQAEATGAKLVKVEQSVASKRAEIKALLAERSKAVDAEITATNEAAAMRIASSWKKGMLMAKVSLISFATSVKTAFRSFAPLLIFEVLFTVLTTVYKQLMKSSAGFRAFVTLIKTSVFGAIKSIAGAIGWVIDKLSQLLGLTGNGGGGKKAGTSKGGGKTKQPQTKTNNDPVLGGGGGGKTPKTPKEPKKTPAQEAAEAVANAQKEYTKSIKKAQNDTLNAADAQSQGLDATKKLYDAYLDAYTVTGNAGYKQKMDQLIPQIEAMSASVEGAKEATDAAKKAAEDAANKRKNAGVAMGKAATIGAETRDTTFDFKNSASENTRLDLEFNLDKAQRQLDLLQDEAVAKTDKVKAAIDKLTSDKLTFEMQLKAGALNEEVKNLKGQLSQSWKDLGQQGWDAIQGTVSNINSLVSTMEDPDASGWEKFAAVVNTVMSLMQTFAGIMQTVNTIQELSTQLTQANTTAKATQSAVTAANTTAVATNAATQSAASASNVASSTAETSAKSTEAIAKATAAGAGMPFPLDIIAIAMGVAAVVAALATSFSKGGIMKFSKGGIPRFAGGGLLSGATPNGDFGLARVNANEMVLNTAQQNRLFRIANGTASAGGGGQAISLRVRGRDLVSCSSNETRTRAKSGHRSNLA